ncbi:hypothetical protein EDB85DRAFT_2142125 [Lactarius pseudohatsudake]|nr:hypothetical protein EDB85DRAFT_2142125 [Lactarius pseudohatsudake]
MSLNSPTSKSLTGALECWRRAMNNMFRPKSDSFLSVVIFKSADDYYRSPECQNRIDPVPKGLYILDRKFVRRERNHDRIGYGGVNQFSSDRPHKRDKTRLADIPSAQLFMRFNRIDWNCAFFKAYYEKRSFGHFSSTLIAFGSFTSPSFGSTPPTTPRPSTSQTDDTPLGGAVATVIMVLATLAEFSYIPTTWNNTSHLTGLTRHLLFLLVTLALTAGPTFYIAIVENQADGGGSFALILGITHFFISVVATLLFGIMLRSDVWQPRRWQIPQARLGSVLEGYICPLAEAHILQDPGDVRLRGSVQAQDLECDHHLDKLLYHQVDTPDGRRSLRAPPFSVAQTDKGFKGSFFPPGLEAERRISFFAQSLTTALPEALPVDTMPTFTLTPHYNEEISADSSHR